MKYNSIAALSAVAFWNLSMEIHAPVEMAPACRFRSRLYREMMTMPESNAARLYAALCGLEDRAAAIALKLLEPIVKPPAAIPVDSVALNQLDFLSHGMALDCGRSGVSISVVGEIAYFPIAKYLALVRGADKVNITINSTGGNTLAVLALLDALQGKQVEVTIAGKANSAAALLAQAGTIRRICADARMMVHQAVAFTAGTAAELRHEADKLEVLRDKCAAIFKRRCKPAMVDKWFSKGDHYFTATEAVAVGLADEVIPAPEPPPFFTAAGLQPYVKPEPGDVDAEAELLARELLGRLRGQFKSRARFDEVVKELVGA